MADATDFPPVRHPVCDCERESEAELSEEILHFASIAARTLMMNNHLSDPGICGRNLVMAALFSAYTLLAHTDGVLLDDASLDREIDEGLARIRATRPEVRRVVETRNAMSEAARQPFKN